MFRYVTIAALLAACSDPIQNDLAELGTSLSAQDETEADHVQSEEEAAAQDLQIIADARGISVEEAAEHQRVTEESGRIAALVAEARPEIFLGRAALFGQGPVIYVKGPADSELQKLVASSSIEIKISDGHPFSLAEMLEKQEQVTDALKSFGFTNFSNGIEIRDATLKVKITREEGLPDDAGAILELLPPSLRVVTRITVSRERVFIPHTAAFGGMETSVGCTTAFSVFDELGATGLVSAGHCTNASTVLHPPSTNHTLTFQRQHQGSYGDVEYHKTSVPEPAQFYASPTLIRNVVAVRPFANMGVGDVVCVYSRVNAARYCANIETLVQSCVDGSITYNRFVEMDDDLAAGGDSGTNWSLSTTAYGVHGGNCGDGDVWTVASNLPISPLVVAVIVQ
jgi:hypothetical protein